MSLSLAICVATMRSEEKFPGDVISALATASKDLPLHLRSNTPDNNLGVIGSYQDLYTRTTEDVLCYLHDDVSMYEKGWDTRVLQEFEDPSVGALGFGGALQHGAPELYKVPYQLQQLRRARYRSNVDDAEVHGERFEGACDVAVLDGFCLIVRRRLLDRIGGWPTVAGNFHCYDYAICALAHRFGYRVRVVGVRCHHTGGKTSTTAEYQEWAKKSGMSDAKVHEESHRWFYNEFRDVLPWVCK